MRIRSLSSWASFVITGPALRSPIRVLVRLPNGARLGGRSLLLERFSGLRGASDCADCRPNRDGFAKPAPFPCPQSEPSPWRSRLVAVLLAVRLEDLHGLG